MKKTYFYILFLFSAFISAQTGADITNLVKINGIQQVNTNRILITDGNGNLSYRIINNISSSSVTLNPNVQKTSITGAAIFRNLPSIDTNRFVTIDDNGNLGYRDLSNITNTNNVIPIDKIGLSATNLIELKNILSLEQNNSFGYAVVVDADGVLGKRAITTATFQKFDYLVIRYFWTSADGTDLDTATGFVNLIGSFINKKSVGWKPNASTYTVGNPPILESIGDNVQNGYESVLISYKNVVSNSPGAQLPSEYRLALAGNWYNTRLAGNVQIELVAYKGGIMSKNLSTFLWENTGGAEVFRSTFLKNVQSTGQSGQGANNLLDSVFDQYPSTWAIGYIIINPQTEVASLYIY